MYYFFAHKKQKVAVDEFFFLLLFRFIKFLPFRVPKGFQTGTLTFQLVELKRGFQKVFRPEL
jgi:hypothetical protein